MWARGTRHKHRLNENSSVRAAGRYLGNRAFWLTTNYTESPLRVLLTSAATILVFAALFALGFTAGNHPEPYADAAFGGYLLLSSESFVTLIHSPTATIPSTPLRALAILEGFTGAFTIALFLFTLTRAVHR
jgi:hypothetical protein